MARNGMVALLGCAGLGAALIAAPWIDQRVPMQLPASFGPGSDAWLRLVNAAKEVQAACVAGDVRRLRALVTPAYAERVEERLRRFDLRLDRNTLKAVGDRDLDVPALGGLPSVTEMPPVLGRSAGDRACLVLDWSDPERDGGYPLWRGLQGVAFYWDGYRFRLDAVAPRPLRPGEPRDAAAATLAGSLLAE